jgi:probable rRNA maturation factor
MNATPPAVTDPDIPPLVEVVIEDDRWSAIDLPALTETAVAAALAELGLPGQGLQAALLACDDARIAVLNADFRGKPVPTNVLSWPAEELAAEEEGAEPAPPEAGDPDDPESLGDIAMAWETCLCEAEVAGIPHTHHVTHLVVHGFLHLLGYDHIRDGDADLMERHEKRILARLGIPDPYETETGHPAVHGKDQ